MLVYGGYRRVVSISSFLHFTGSPQKDGLKHYRWKLGQLSPGSNVQFRRISYSTAVEIQKHNEKFLAKVEEIVSGQQGEPAMALYNDTQRDQEYSPKLYQKRESESEKDAFVLRQVCFTKFQSHRVPNPAFVLGG